MDPALALAIFALGLAFGSFLNVCIYRLPEGLSVIHPGSACPKCKATVAFYDNIPILSWLLLRGRCRHCKETISARYLVVELLTGALFLGCYAHFGLTLAGLKYCAFGFLLLPALTVHPFARNMRQFTILASLCGGAMAFLGFWVAYSVDLPVGPTDVVLLGVLYAAGWLIAKLFPGGSK